MAMQGGPSDCWTFANPHDRPILCLDVDTTGRYCVTGSADHGLRLWDLPNRQLKAELFGTRYGHYEWVTCCAFSAENRVVSGGMDGKICIWKTENMCKPPLSTSRKPASHKNLAEPSSKLTASTLKRWQRPIACKASTNSTSCREVDAHSGSVSDLKIDYVSNIGVSSGYDACLSIWNIHTAQKKATLSKGHNSPILKFCWEDSFLCSGDRKGGLCIWDATSSKLVSKLKEVHSGAVGDLCTFHATKDGTGVPYSIVFSGGLNDGCLSALDPRVARATICNMQIHNGAITKLLLLRGSKKLLCTLSGDKTCKLFDFSGLGSDFLIRPLATVAVTDAVFCGEVTSSSSIIVGTGDGNVYPIDFTFYHNGTSHSNPPTDAFVNAAQGKILWGYGCDSKGAIHGIKVIQEYPIGNAATGIVAGGDDGALSLIKF